MTKYASDKALLFWDGYNLTGYSTELSLETRALTQDMTVLGNTWRQHAHSGLKEADVSYEAFYDTDIDAAFAALTGSGTGLVLFEGNTAGKKAVGLAGMLQSGYPRRTTLGEFHRAKGEFQVSGDVEEGMIIAPHAAYDSDPAVVAGQDNTESSNAGGSGYLQVTALTLGGYTNIIVKIRDSEDDVTYADLIAFTAVTAAPADERKTVTGTVNRYVNTEWAFTGTGTGESASFITVFKRNPST